MRAYPSSALWAYRGARQCISRGQFTLRSVLPRVEKLPPWHKRRRPRHRGRRPHATGTFWALALGSIGVVYGDIGTSPLYAFREAVKAARARRVGPDAVLGILSLMVWTMLLIVTLKYVLVLLNADNKGEGGTFALMALGQSVAKRSASADPGARRDRRGLLLRRCRHHAGHLGAVGGGRPEAGRAAARSDVVLPLTIVILVAAVRRAVARHGKGRAVFRADHARVVRRARRRRPRSTSSTIRASSSPSTRCSASSSS